MPKCKRNRSQLQECDQSKGLVMEAGAKFEERWALPLSTRSDMALKKEQVKLTSTKPLLPFKRRKGQCKLSWDYSTQQRTALS